MRKKTFLPFAVSMAWVCVYALPVDPVVVQGQASVAADGNNALVQASDKAVIHWKDFSIRKGETLRFLQPHAKASVLNRVTGKDISSLMGILEANGRIFLVNPNGVVIGSEGLIRASAFFASTLDVDTADFLAGKDLLFTGLSDAPLINFGTIETSCGSVALMGLKVENYGSIKAPFGSAALLAGREILLRPEGEALALIRPLVGGEVAQEGKIEALQVQLEAFGDPYRLAIRHSGKTQAVTVAKEGGRVKIIAKEGAISIGGSIEAPSGSVDVLAPDIYMQKEALIDVSGPKSGKEVHLIADRTMIFEGKVLAEGGSEAGDGGFVEVSGHERCAFFGRVSTLAPQGKTGELLIDPGDVTIGNFGGAGSSSPAFVPPTYDPAVAPGNLDVVDLVAGLGGANVTISTTAGGFGFGNITIAAPFTWATGFNLILNPSNDLTVNAVAQCTGGGGITVSANNIVVSAGASAAGLETASGAIDLTCFPGDLVLQGGSAANASATIRSDSGLISLHNAYNVSLTGGSQDLTFAEVSSRLGNVTFDLIRHDLTLQGGTAATSTNAYAQIGKGQIAAGQASVASNILFSELRNLVSIKGGDAAGAYTQIGHAPSPGTVAIDVSGDVSLLRNGNLLTDIELQGGSAANTTAVIGHGNEFSSFVHDCSGKITLQASGGMNIKGGTGSRSHAIVGFHSPETGALANFTCTTNNTIDIQTIVDVNVTAGTGSNAVIGYYNPNVTAASPRDVRINGGEKILLNMPTPWNVNLQAGNTGGVNAGAAVIGTYVGATPANNAQSVIDINTSALNVLGPGPGNDGAALIVNNDYVTPITTAADNVTITLGAVATDITVLGGTGATTGLAEIYASNNLVANFNGNLAINREISMMMVVLQKAPARVVAGNNVMINPVTSGTDVFLYGGDNPAAEALIRSVNGPVTFGTANSAENRDLFVGEPSGLSRAPSRILTDSGASRFFFSGNVALTAGTGGGAPAPTAEIISNTGTLNFDIGFDLSLKGGTSSMAYSEISSVGGDMRFEIGRNATLQGGSATNTYAQIGKGFLSAATPTIASNIDFPVLTQGLSLQGGSGIGSYAQIGHSPFGIASATDITAGNITLPAFGVLNGISLTGGSNTDATAAIGHGNELSTYLRDVAGSIDVTSITNLTLTAGTAPFVPKTHAVIGFQNPTAGSSVPFNVNSTGINVSSRNALLDAKEGSNAVIGYYNGSGAGGASVSIASVQLSTPSFGVVDLQAGNNGGTGAGAAAIGTFATGGSAVQSTVAVSTGDLNLLGPKGADDGSSVVFGFGSSVYANAADAIFMGKNAIMANGGAGPLLALAGTDMVMRENAAAFTITGDLTLVVDNRYPSPPGIGNGKIVKEFGATIGSTSGKVRIFTARQPLNQISGNINGVLYVPGPQYVDSPTEHWFTYYFNSFGGSPFTIFYKDPTVVPPIPFIEIMTAFSEMAYDLSSYDDLIFSPHLIELVYDCEAYRKKQKVEECFSSFDEWRSVDHRMMRRLYRNYHMKKVDPLQ